MWESLRSVPAEGAPFLTIPNLVSAVRFRSVAKTTVSPVLLSRCAKRDYASAAAGRACSLEPVILVLSQKSGSSQE